MCIFVKEASILPPFDISVYVLLCVLKSREVRSNEVSVLLESVFYACKKRCNVWSHDEEAQPLGTFNVIINGSYSANKMRGPRFQLRCSRCHKRKFASSFQLV